MDDETIDRKVQLMDCMLGQGAHGIIIAGDKQYPSCPLIKCDSDMLPYDCCYRGRLIYTTRLTSNGKVENHYECMRCEK